MHTECDQSIPSTVANLTNTNLTILNGKLCLQYLFSGITNFCHLKATLTLSGHIQQPVPLISHFNQAGIQQVPLFSQGRHFVIGGLEILSQLGN